jgi:thymidylate synthase (FAD)
MKIVEAQIIPITPINGHEIVKVLEQVARTCYKSHDKITDDGESAIRLLQTLANSGHGAMFEHYSITMRYVSNIAAYKDLTRHRPASYAIESSRWCNYSKGKFGNEIKFLSPVEIPKNSLTYQVWINAMQKAEDYYMTMASMGAKPDELSLLLPQSTAAEFNITANLREWEHIFNLRAVGHSRPCVKQIMQPTLELFHSKIPVVFDAVYKKLQLERSR